jgi:predicted lipoprotein with Yx(FWY)xxD motif
VLGSFAVKSAISIAAGAGIFLFSPMTLHAAAATSSAAVTAALDTSPFIAAFTGYTYPDTSAGLSACDTEGAYLFDNSDGNFVGSYCSLGDPDAGVYNLWVREWNPNYCRTC